MMNPRVLNHSRLFVALLCCSLGEESLRAAEPASRPPAFWAGMAPSIRVPAFDLPLSDLLSQETRDALYKGNLELQEYANACFAAKKSEGDLAVKQCAFALNQSEMNARTLKEYGGVLEQKTLGGVPVTVVRPASGVSAANKRRVLLNVGHGNMEAIPIAALGKIEVVSIDFVERMRSGHADGVADIVSAYKGLLADHAPQDIGLYGCAGGFTEMLLELQKARIPRPGAVGIISGPVFGAGGDSARIYAAIVNEPWTGRTPGTGIDAVPADALAKFPTLLLTASTRDVFLSAMAVAQTRLTQLGVEVELHVWEGLIHGTVLEPSIPESRDMYAVIARFFNKRLGSRSH